MTRLWFLARKEMAILFASPVAYLVLTSVAVNVVKPAELAESAAPLALVYSRASGQEAVTIGIIAILATTNGALIQIIMAARVLYGLGRQAELPAVLARIDPRTRTPLLATGLVTLLVAALAIFFPIVTLAKATSAIALVIFCVVNLALVALKRRGPTPPGLPNLPLLVPLAGLVVSAAFLVLESLRLATDWAG